MDCPLLESARETTFQVKDVKSLNTERLMDRRQVLQYADDNTDFNYRKFKVLNYWYQAICTYETLCKET